MMIIGKLFPTVTNGVQTELQGEVKTLQMQLKISLMPAKVKRSDNDPDYLIFTPGYSGESVQIGAAWKKVKQQIGDVITEFLSINIDDPGLPNALNVAAFKKDDGSYEIVWRRRQVTQTQSSAA
jgi:uncharacterized protein (DUF736 family)